MNKVTGINPKNLNQIWERVGDSDVWKCKDKNFTVSTDVIEHDIKNGHLKEV